MGFRHESGAQERSSVACGHGWHFDTRVQQQLSRMILRPHPEVLLTGALTLGQDCHPSSEVGKKGFHIHLRFILSLPEVIYTQRLENYGSKLWSKTPFCEISTFEELHIYLTSGSLHIQNSGSKLESKSLILFMNRRREIIWCWHTPVSLQFFQKTYYCSNVWY